MSTLIPIEWLHARARTEGIDITKICVAAPRWAESARCQPGAKSALVRCDLIIRDDGSVVYLDGMMGGDSVSVAQMHTGSEKMRDYFTSFFPEIRKQGLTLAQVCARTIRELGWDAYAARLTALPDPTSAS